MRRLLIALALVALPSVAYAQFPSDNVTLPTFVIPASAVSGSGSFTGQLLGPVTPTDCSAPQYSFTGDTNSGVGYIASDTIGLCAGGAATAYWSGSVFAVKLLGLDQSSTDVLVGREAAGHWFQKNSTNAQRASWANTYTSATNYGAVSIDMQTVANVGMFGTRTAATGSAFPLRLGAEAANGANSYATINLDGGALPLIRLEPLVTNALAAANVSSAGNFIQFGANTTSTVTSGSVAYLAVLPTYNQTSGTASNCDLCIDRTETAVGSGAQYSIKTGDDGNTRFYVKSGGATGRGTQIGTAQAVAPTCSSNCGTSPSVSGSDTAMTVTMGTSGSPASGWVVTFNGTWATAPSCHVQMAKAGMVVGKMPLTVVTTTTTLTVVTNGTAPATTDIYHILCMGIS